jgi:hypothetical protein
MIASSVNVFGIYLFLIASFYFKTDGFRDEPNRLRYSFLWVTPIIFQSPFLQEEFAAPISGSSRPSWLWQFEGQVQALAVSRTFGKRLR